jgi:hypothetical protein
MTIRVLPLSDAWAERRMQVCVRDRAALPAFADELIALLLHDAAGAEPGGAAPGDLRGESRGGPRGGEPVV